MWVIPYIEAENFFSHEKIQYKLVNNELTMIYGNNFDRSKKKSNGSGKSVMLDCIAFAITGDTLRKLKTLKKIINNNASDCYSEVHLENEATKESLIINRSLGRKQAQKVSIIYNGEVQVQLVDLHPRESDKFICEKLGISFDDLLNYYLISKFKYKSLFLAGDTDKKEVINRFSKADIVDSVFPLIDKDIETYTTQYSEKNIKLTESKTKIQMYEEEMEKLVNEDIKEKIKKKVAEINGNIEIKKSNIKLLDEAIDYLNSNKEVFNKKIIKFNNLLNTKKTIEELNKSIKGKETDLQNKRTEYTNVRKKYSSNFSKIDSDEKQYKSEKKTFEEDIDVFNDAIKELEKFIAGEIECPNCKHHFILADKQYNIEEGKKQIVELTKEKETSEKNLLEHKKKDNFEQQRSNVEVLIKQDQQKLEKDASQIKSDTEKLEDEKKYINRIKDLVSGYTLLIKNIDEKVKTKNQSKETNNTQIEQYKADIIEAKKENNKDAISSLNKKIELETESQVRLEKELLSIQENQKQVTEWKNKFKRFKSFLANQALVQIEQQSNYFLDKMKADMQVIIDGYRELSNGKLKEEITVELSRDGLEGEEFGAFSGGEKSNADLSSILAMQNIINSTSSSGGLNFLGIDEILESVDEEGMNDIVRCLSQLNQTILLIAHSQPNESIDVNKLIVEKRNGISKILIS